MHPTFTCKTQPHAGEPLQESHFLRFSGKPTSSSDFSEFGVGSGKERRGEKREVF